MKASLKIHIREEDKNDGLLEKIGDAATMWDVKEKDGGDVNDFVLEYRKELLYALTVSDDEDGGALVELVKSFKQTMWKLFDACHTLSYVSVLYVGDEYELDDIREHFENDDRDIQAYLTHEGGSVN